MSGKSVPNRDLLRGGKRQTRGRDDLMLVPREVRVAIWARLGSDLKPRHLDKLVTRTINIDELPSAFDGFIKNQIQGRTVVKIA